MPLRKNNTRHFHRVLYSGQLETVTLLKREDGQKSGNVRSILLFEARRGMEYKTGEPIQGEMSSAHSMEWHLPVSELEANGVTYINPGDAIVDENGFKYQYESESGSLTTKLFRNHICMPCVRRDPPTGGD